jgi:Zn-dependent protease
VFIERLSTDPVSYVCWLTAIVVSVTLHELGHVFAALRQGDDTPRLLGRVTLDPLVHMGWASLIMAALVGIAWGVTPVNPNAFRSRFGNAIVAFGGPLVNLLLALISFTALALLKRHGGPDVAEGNNLWFFLRLLGILNVLLFVFNMLPIPPLDGATILGNFWPGFDRLRYLPEAQPWFFSAVLAAAILLVPRLVQLGGDLATRYVALWS